MQYLRLQLIPHLILFHFYIDLNDKIYNHKVNANQTFMDQQKQGRRPRFSIYSEIIVENGLKPIKKGILKATA